MKKITISIIIAVLLTALFSLLAITALADDDLPTLTPTEIDSIHIEGVVKPVVGQTLREWSIAMWDAVENGSITVNGNTYDDANGFGGILDDGFEFYDESKQHYGYLDNTIITPGTYYVVWYLGSEYFADDLSIAVDGVNNSDFSFIDEPWIKVYIKFEVTAPTTTEIDSIHIEGIPAPQYGMGIQEYDDNVLVEKIKNGSITVNGQVCVDDAFGNIWFDGARAFNKDENVPEDYYTGAKFEEDTYYLGFWFMPATGYTFADDLSATVDGVNNADVSIKDAGDDWIVVWIKYEITAPTTTEIDSIHIEGIPAPQYGMGVKEYDDNVVEEKIKNGTITVNGQVCVDEDFGNIMADGARTFHKDESIFDNVPEYYYTAKFEEDTYYLGFWFMPATGYTFADDLSATVDGVNNADVSIKDAGDGWIVVWIKFEVSNPDHVHSPKDEWKSDADNHWHECTGCAGQQLEKTAHEDDDNDGKCDVCTYKMYDIQYIYDGFDLILEGYEIGNPTKASIDGTYIRTPEDVHYFVFDHKVFKYDALSDDWVACAETDVFEAGARYMVDVTLWAETGYELRPSEVAGDMYDVTLNGIVGFKDTLGFTGYSFYLPPLVESGEKCPEGEIVINGYVEGNDVVDLSLGLPDGYTSGAYGVGFMLEGIESDEVLDNTGIYRLICVISLPANYDFNTFSKETLTVFGCEPDVVAFAPIPSAVMLQLIYTLPDAPKTGDVGIDKIELTLNGYEIGASTDDVWYSPKESAEYVSEFAQFVLGADSYDEYIGNIVAGQKYYYMISIEAKPGYTLISLRREDVTLNGKAPVSFYYEDGIFLCLTYELDELSVHTHAYDNACDKDCNECGAIRTPAAHVYANACDTTCDTCGATRSITHTYSTIWKSDASGHWHECSVCLAKKDEASHTPGAAATETTPQICTKCDFVITPALGHTHSAKTEWSGDETYHWHDCIGNDGKQFNKAKHIYDNACDKDCNECGAARTPAAHAYDNDCDKDCNECGATRTPAAHVYDNACDKDCNVCGAARTPAAHVYDNACDADCNECGLARTPADHRYDNPCDKDCNECGETRTTSHSYSSDWSYNSGKHWRECSVCHAKKDEASHTPGAAATETTPQICTVCSLVITPALSHTHSAKTEWSSDETYHWHDCIGNDAYQLDKAEHSYDNNCDADCSACGFVRTVLDHKDEDENGKCDSCDADMPGADPGPAPTPTPTPDPKPEKKGLSGGAIAAILIGATVVLASGGFAIYWFVIQKKSVEDLVVLVKKAFAPNVTEEIPEVNTEDNSEKSPEESNE